MGIFGNNSGKSLQIVRELAHDANDTNKEIGELVQSFEDEHSKLETVSEDFGKFAEQIKDKLELDEFEKLVDYVELIGDLHSHYLKSYNSILQLSNNQMSKTKNAIAHYKNISK